MRNLLFLVIININCLLFYGCCDSKPSVAPNQYDTKWFESKSPSLQKSLLELMPPDSPERIEREQNLENQEKVCPCGCGNKECVGCNYFPCTGVKSESPKIVGGYICPCGNTCMAKGSNGGRMCQRGCGCFINH